MSGFSFDSNIIIDALAGFAPARAEIDRATNFGAQAWISRVVWIEVMSKGDDDALWRTETLLSGFGVDEIDAEVSRRAAALRRGRSRLKAMDAIILATAQLRGRVLVTRNIKDFPAEMPGIRVPYQI